MKRTLFFVVAFVLGLLQVYPASAINVDVSKMLVSVDGITEDTNWITIDLSAYKPWKSKVRSLYLVMFTGASSTCPGDSVHFLVRPFGDEANARHQFSRATSADLQNTDEHVQYVWLPLNKSNKIQYKVESITCPSANVDVKLGIVGYEMVDTKRWDLIYEE